MGNRLAWLNPFHRTCPVEMAKGRDDRMRLRRIAVGLALVCAFALGTAVSGAAAQGCSEPANRVLQIESMKNPARRIESMKNPVREIESMDQTTDQSSVGGESDRDLLAELHRVVLVEEMISDQAKQRATNPQVKDLAGQLSRDQRSLDGQVRAVAGQLRIGLPDRLSARDQAVPAQLAGESGPQFDHDYVNRTHAAEAQSLSDVGAVRATTRDATERSFTEQVGLILLQHLRLLESTNLVDESGFPAPATAMAPSTGTTSIPAPTTTDQATGSADAAPGGVAPFPKPVPPPAPTGLEQPEGGDAPAAIALVCVVGAAATIGTLRVLRKRKSVGRTANPGFTGTKPTHRREVVSRETRKFRTR